MKKKFFFGFILSLSLSVYGQTKMDKTLNTLNKGSVPYVHITELNPTDSLIFLDARKKEEFKVSHIKNAIWVGYDTFDQTDMAERISNKNTPIIVYCSIGVRSEDIGEQLLAQGYTNVKNLYGGIFNWKNNDLPVYRTDGTETQKVHAFNKHWGKLLTKGEKVYVTEKKNKKKIKDPNPSINEI